MLVDKWTLNVPVQNSDPELIHPAGTALFCFSLFLQIPGFVSSFPESCLAKTGIKRVPFGRVCPSSPDFLDVGLPRQVTPSGQLRVVHPDTDFLKSPSYGSQSPAAPIATACPAATQFFPRGLPLGGHRERMQGVDAAPTFLRHFFLSPFPSGRITSRKVLAWHHSECFRIYEAPGHNDASLTWKVLQTWLRRFPQGTGVCTSEFYGGCDLNQRLQVFRVGCSNLSRGTGGFWELHFGTSGGRPRWKKRGFVCVVFLIRSKTWGSCLPFLRY